MGGGVGRILNKANRLMPGSSAQSNQAYSPNGFPVLPSIYEGNQDPGHSWTEGLDVKNSPYQP